MPRTGPILTRYGYDARSVFDLLGHGEVDLTAALAWTLSRSPTLMAALWARLGLPGDPAQVQPALEVADPEGRTDLELVGDRATAIIEAKKGWLVPGESQLALYAKRIPGGQPGLLVSLSDSSAVWAGQDLPRHIEGTPVRHLPWDDIRSDLRTVTTATRGTERHWLTELTTYLAGATSVRDPAQQWVYCVVTSTNNVGDPSRNFRDYVQKDRVYFHPFAKNWPKRPLVLVAFRWGGVIRQVNRVEQATVVPNLQTRWPDLPRIPDRTDVPHVLYDLGPDIPIPVIPTKGTYPNARVWVLLDQLLTQPTLPKAVRTSRQLASPPSD